MEIILGLFGLVNAGVVLGNIGVPTVLVLLGLLVGKPLGITLFTWFVAKFFKLEIPGGMSYRHVLSRASAGHQNGRSQRNPTLLTTRFLVQKKRT